MKKLVLTAALAAFAALCIEAAPIWKISERGTIVLDASSAELPHYDHIEMSGQMVSTVLRWGINADGSFKGERSLVFPMLRTVPNNTHASLTHRIGTDIPSLLSVDGMPLGAEKVESVEIDGLVRVVSRYNDFELVRTVFPSVSNPLVAEIYELRNLSERSHTVYVPEFSQQFRTLAENGVDGVYVIRADITGAGTTVLGKGESLCFGAVFQACREAERPLEPDLCGELSARRALVAQFDGNLRLETPDPVIDREFRYAKIRGAESIYKTAGGFMHGPGGEAYYAAIWANDQAEYINPFFPFLGYGIGNESALNSYRHFARFINPSYNPIPSSIIAEGKDIWNGVGDRGDAAMIAHGACRYLLARCSLSEAEELWPLVEWCLEYCHRKLNDAGVVASDCDELEHRFPSGSANLCTSTLYYDALLSASMLARELGKPERLIACYRRRAAALASAIENYFGADIEGFRTYRYYDGNTVLRSWICMPLIVGLKGREQGTIAALTSPLLLTEDGILTEQGSDTFWDRSTLYSLRGMYIAGDVAISSDFLHRYSERRLLGSHVPYPVEAWPEGSQRHLSAESGLYCRTVIEGMFGIRPTGFHSFALTPRLAQGWDRMALRNIRAFGTDFDIEVVRDGSRLLVTVTDNCNGRVRKFKVASSATVNVKLI